MLTSSSLSYFFKDEAKLDLVANKFIRLVCSFPEKSSDKPLKKVVIEDLDIIIPTKIENGETTHNEYQR
jgi:hypothetical protein